MATPQFRNPNGAFGASTNDPQAYGAVVEYFVASAAVAVGAVVILDTANAGQVKTATASVDSRLVVGIAAEAAASTEVVPVVVSGWALATTKASLTAGNKLGTDGTNAGRVVAVTDATAVTQAKDLGVVVAIAAETKDGSSTETTLRVWVKTY